MANVDDLFSGGKVAEPVSPGASHTSSAPEQTGGFSRFVIGTFEAIVGFVFFAIWLGIAGLAFAMAQNTIEYGRMSSGGVLLILAGIAFGFVAAVCSTGIVIVLLDMRKQLIEIRKALNRA